MRSLPLLFSFEFSPFFSLVHNSFRILTYRGICLITFNNGILTSTFQKVYKISCSTFSFFLLANLPGNESATKIFELGKTGVLLTSSVATFKVVGYASMLFFSSIVKSGEVVCTTSKSYGTSILSKVNLC